MERYDYLVIGGGIAGGIAAEGLREGGPSGSIAIVSDERHPLYSRVLLPNYVKGLADRERVFLKKTEEYRAKRIELLAGETAERLDAAGRTLRLSSGPAIE